MSLVFVERRGVLSQRQALGRWDALAVVSAPAPGAAVSAELIRVKHEYAPIKASAVFFYVILAYVTLNYYDRRKY